MRSEAWTVHWTHITTSSLSHGDMDVEWSDFISRKSGWLDYRECNAEVWVGGMSPKDIKMTQTRDESSMTARALLNIKNRET